jgi:cytochrome c-type biogenesis protein
VSVLISAAAAVWLGILTSISPCPLATNVVAMSFVAKHVGSVRKVVLAGFFYTLGRTVAYVGLAAILVAGLLSIPGASNFLQHYMNLLLGPVLIVAGLFLVELLALPISVPSGKGKLQGLAEKGGVLGAGLLGLVFALAFCPVSAALFFGSLLPLCLDGGSPILLPALYGIGTALPVIGFAVLIAAGTKWVGVAFGLVTKFERWARRGTGILFIAVGVYLSLKHIFGVLG